ncbi:hypothetical protein [Streptomyces aidingensis]|uniref:Helicase ATP-binding domain-containing protein n=1 Tax=Streptomyces aidingensis TaxID=910347 RepID=A0A1I1S9L5_9ACTN|nr:hypothetical protein [Streptomyces aidingensis]SFD43032.1 hypothetical protein SAMN05421773_11530 [Streptomyces aidingensis]
MSTQAPETEQVFPRIMAVAIGLAAAFFPSGGGSGFRRTTTRDDVFYVLDGHIADWSGWHNLSETDARRFARLLHRRPNQMANAKAAGPILDRLLSDGRIPGCTVDDQAGGAGQITVDPGMPLPAYIDTFLGQLDELHAAKNRSLPPAQAGPHMTTTRVVVEDGRKQTFVDFHYGVRPHHLDPGHPIPAVRDAPDLPEKLVLFAELKEIAHLIDQEERKHGRSAHRRDAVDRFEEQVRTRENKTVKGLHLTAGNLNELLAYTGFGKSVVLVETFACWAVRHEVPVAFVLPTNADVVRATHTIERALKLCGVQSRNGVVPLVSPRALIKVAETAASRVTAGGPDADWIWGRFGYGCALASVAESDDGVDRWQPGNEPCAKLRKPSRGRRKNATVACPWRTSCGRYRAARQACTADVIVTSHANLLLGVLQTPVDDGYGVNDRLTVEELLMRRCQVIVIDEVDVFQSTAIDHAGRHLVLDHAGQTNTPLRRFDHDFAAASGRLQDEVDASVRDSYLSLRYLSETYVSHLTYERLGATVPAKGRRPRGPGRYWMVPWRWDNWLTARLFGLDPKEVEPEHLKRFSSLFPNGPAPRDKESEDFREARRHLESVVSGGSGGLSLHRARAALEQLAKNVPEEHRTKVVNRILRRTMLEPIRMFLHRLMANNAQLVDIGVESAQDLADALGTYGRWRVTPTGPLGRLVFAFTEYYDDTGGAPARLSTAAFGGDPHTYTVGLGDTTALSHAGVRRIVLGMSATSYFPGAPHHHLHTVPKWWVADNQENAVRIRPARIDDERGRPRRISGLDGAERVVATRRIARALWDTYLRAELKWLHDNRRERHRVLLATTSYEAARHVAEGLSAAGVDAGLICLAVRPGIHADEESTAVDAGRWREIPADRLEEFPAVTGADILIAPLARVQRGVNIIGEGDKSALGSVWLIIRPIPLIDEPAELVAHIQARALAKHRGPSSDPRALLAERRSVAGQYLDDIIRRPPYFQAQPLDVKLGVVAEIINGAVQLIGRARRGGTDATLHLVDGALLDPSGGTDLATLILKLRDTWHRDGVLPAMRQYYGTTLEAFLTYAEQPTEGDILC